MGLNYIDHDRLVRPGQWSQSPDWIPPLNHFIEWSTGLRGKSQIWSLSTLLLDLTWEPGRAWTWCWSWSVGAQTSRARSSPCWPDSPPSGRTRRKEAESGGCWRWTGAPRPLSGSSPRTLHRGDIISLLSYRTSWFWTTKTKMDYKVHVIWRFLTQWHEMAKKGLISIHTLYILWRKYKIQSWNVLW